MTCHGHGGSNLESRSRWTLVSWRPATQPTNHPDHPVQRTAAWDCGAVSPQFPCWGARQAGASASPVKANRASCSKPTAPCGPWCRLLMANFGYSTMSSSLLRGFSAAEKVFSRKPQASTCKPPAAFPSPPRSYGHFGRALDSRSKLLTVVGRQGTGQRQCKPVTKFSASPQRRTPDDRLSLSLSRADKDQANHAEGRCTAVATFASWVSLNDRRT